MEQVNEVGGGLIVEGFVSEQKDGLELDLLWNREPVEVLGDSGHVVTTI